MQCKTMRTWSLCQVLGKRVCQQRCQLEGGTLPTMGRNKSLCASRSSGSVTNPGECQETSWTNGTSAAQEVVIAIGSNVGNRMQNFNKALELIRKAGIDITGHACLYESAPAYVTNQPYFLNSAIRASTYLDPHALLQTLKQIERNLGRAEGGVRFGPRVMDLDILFYGISSVNTDVLQIPHPRLAERPFVVAPLMDLLGSQAKESHSSNWTVHPSITGGLQRVWRDMGGENIIGKGELRRVIPFKKKLWEWSGKTHIMGILNVTPDSFSDGGKYISAEKALSQVQAMILAGADFIDVGAQSTRPGARKLSTEEELGRLLPVLEKIQDIPEMEEVFLSVDTFNSKVAQEAVAKGAQMINDVSGGTLDLNMWTTVAGLEVPYVAMHMRGDPSSMQSAKNTQYIDVCSEVADELTVCVRQAEFAGIPAWRMIIDPGLGFAKDVEHCLELIRKLPTFREELSMRMKSVANGPILLGPSRKSFLGKITGHTKACDRDFATAAVVAVSVAGGANIIRAHNVQAVRDAAMVADAMYRCDYST